MPTLTDPLADAAESAAALRGLAHATRDMPPTSTYPVLGELIAGTRSLRQVLDQLTRSHVDAHELARTDDGDPFRGRVYALAAADALNLAANALDEVQVRLDLASQPPPGSPGSRPVSTWPGSPSTARAVPRRRCRDG